MPEHFTFIDLDFGGTVEIAPQAALMAESGPQAPLRAVFFKAAWTNQGNIYVGRSAVSPITGTSTRGPGIELGPGETSVIFVGRNLSQFWVLNQYANDSVIASYFVQPII